MSGREPSTATTAPRSSARWRRLSATPAASTSIDSGSGLSVRRPSRESLRMALISRSILRVEERMKPIASGISSATTARASRPTRPGAFSSASATSLVSEAAAASSSLVKPITLTRGERRSWLTM